MDDRTYGSLSVRCRCRFALFRYALGVLEVRYNALAFPEDDVPGADITMHPATFMNELKSYTLCQFAGLSKDDSIYRCMHP